MLIILFPYKFINFFFKKYQVKELKKKFKNKFEIHDVSQIISKKQVSSLKVKRHKSAIIFKKVSDWNTYMKKKISENRKIYVINIIHLNSFRSLYIHYLLYKYKVNIIKITSPEVFAPSYSNTIFIKLSNIIKSLLFNQSRLYFIAKKIIIKKLILFLKYEKLFVTLCGSKSKNLLMPLENNAKKIKFIDFHASDYANYLSNKKEKKIKNKNYVIFLDLKAPAFAGDDFLFNNPIKYDVDKWYKDLNNFLINVEKIFKTKVIIIPHPSVRKLKNKYYNSKFTVSKDFDASNKLIPNSRFVIANGATTAVSFCIIHNKPVTLIYADQVKKFNPGMLFETKCLSSCLSVKSLNINKKIYKSKFSSKINKKSYSNYKYSFLTSKSIKKINNSEILEKIITQ
jgi:hypothetical protein